MSQFRSQYRIDATLDVLRRFSRRETLFDYQSSPINPGGRVCARVANSLARSNFQFTLPNVSRMGCIGSSHARNESGGESNRFSCNLFGHRFDRLSCSFWSSASFVGFIASHAELRWFVCFFLLVFNLRLRTCDSWRDCMMFSKDFKILNIVLERSTYARSSCFLVFHEFCMFWQQDARKSRNLNRGRIPSQSQGHSLWTCVRSFGILLHTMVVKEVYICFL